jgi:hypothetical protein
MATRVIGRHRFVHIVAFACGHEKRVHVFKGDYDPMQRQIERKDQEAAAKICIDCWRRLKK